ncbi:hypothetical protein N7448_009992 [Penicillium atrosanguineum]|uniref:uncharacterized protein n=1 Tax=Penicillium atrosanguineum TaxID=1132637 RepID=UPI0023992FCB|nr:uncharacterized protein N7443_007208 [Penicillium atrosanguineum]KAJ5118278.1 hypothetical protein N7526_009915 [Penicillium atrosanguineum]KAJ5119323.1 hypothetical protein N7448_009992 [Penicillium atrosanguineum]KAJ5296315.1 hypothetical protein N7443_007208 [Penicillium atrosanguineum]
MRSTFFSLCVWTAFLAECAHAEGPNACSKSPYEASRVGKAVYFQLNEQHNAVVSIPIGTDGTLHGGVITRTDGMGSDGIDGATMMPAGPDALSSQGSVVVNDNYLFAVNAGSNTLSMFKIDANDATKLSMIGMPAAIPGDFPVTVAASVKRNVVCVGYTGAKAGTSCASFTPDGINQMEQVLDFDLGQTTPPTGPTNTVAQVFFTANDTRLITTVKGDPTTNKTGFISVLPFKDSCSTDFELHDTRSTPSGTAVLFGGVNIPDTSDLFITDASFGTTLLDLNPTTDTVSLQSKVIIEGQKATCWAAYSQARESFFVTDAATNRLIEISEDGSSIMSILDLNNGDPGMVDLQTSGRFVYALSPGNGTTPAAITVVDSFKGQQIQHFKLDKLGAGKLSQGMAILE